MNYSEMYELHLKCKEGVILASDSIATQFIVNH
jgi:hypothetical protein